jgi:hypothetical protein
MNSLGRMVEELLKATILFFEEGVMNVAHAVLFLHAYSLVRQMSQIGESALNCPLG